MRIAGGLLGVLLASAPAHAGSKVDLSLAAGLAHLNGGNESATGLGFDLGAGLRNGPVTLSLLGSSSILYPLRTVIVAQAALEAGRWTSQAFVDTWEWAGRDTGDDGLNSLKVMGALMASPFLALTYVAVPVLLIASPFASIGQLAFGPILRVDTGDAPALFFEGGAQFLLYSMPSGVPGSGMAPALGLGVEIVEDIVVGMRVSVSPVGWHTDHGVGDSPVWNASLYVGL